MAERDISRIDRIWQRLDANRRLEVFSRKYHGPGDARRAGQPASSSHEGAVHPEGDEGAGRE
eukprot:4381590-Pyramimonas_sp.AAC.1